MTIQQPNNASMLLDLLVEEAGIPNVVSEMLHRILNTAFQDGRLCRMQEEFDRKYKNNNEQQNVNIQHIC